MNEITLRFGKAQHLVGTLSLPAARSELAVIFLSAGLLHRIGPHRLHVRLARAAAHEGVASIRFDMPGVGDSASAPGRESYEVQSLQAAVDAMDLLHLHSGATRFVVAGLCAGADRAFEVAIRDARVDGVYMMEPPLLMSNALSGVSSALARLKEYGLRMTILRAWQLLRQFRTAQPADGDSGLRNVPPPGEYENSLLRLVQRNVHIRLIYAASTMGDYDLRRHRRHSFRRLLEHRQFGLQIVSGSDHLFTQTAATTTVVQSFIELIRGLSLHAGAEAGLPQLQAHQPDRFSAMAKEGG